MCVEQWGVSEGGGMPRLRRGHAKRRKTTKHTSGIFLLAAAVAYHSDLAARQTAHVQISLDIILQSVLKNYGIDFRTSILIKYT